jgi:hypothetical protein
MWKAVRVVSANFLERIGEPASRLHSRYLAYRKGDIPQAELIARLPHVALVGESVYMGIYISSAWSTFWRARSCHGNNWFLDTNPAPLGIQSVSKRLEELTPFVAIECAGIGALVDPQGKRQNLFRRILRTRNFSGQIGDLLVMKVPPATWSNLKAVYNGKAGTSGTISRNKCGASLRSRAALPRRSHGVRSHQFRVLFHRPRNRRTSAKQGPITLPRP